MRMYEKRLPISGYVYCSIHVVLTTITASRIANDTFWPRSWATNYVSRAASRWFFGGAILSISVQIKTNHDDHTESRTRRW